MQQADYKDWIDETQRGPRGRHIAAFFDLDRTLISVYSAITLLREQVDQRQLTLLDAAQQFLVALAHSKDMLQFNEALNASVMMLEGEREQTFTELAESAFRKHWRSKIYPEALELVKAHQKSGHKLVIISSATRYQIAPIARELGIDEILCTELEVVEGLLTGEVSGSPCWGEGKLVAAEDHATQFGLDLDQSFFYSDAAEDLPLLERVGNPRPLNPDKELQRAAKEHGWQTVGFKSRSKPELADIIRTGLMYGSIVPAAMLGVYSWMMGRSPRDAALSAYTIFANLGLMMAGVNLNVKGEKHLWSHRPAIFVTNHQSILDGFIVPYLLQEKMFVMGKKEARDLPLIGKTMEMAGFILFDRHDPEKARAACDAAAENIRNGYSLAIAPEGTRTHTQKLAPFKKGAFHIALQTRVPIIPIVIKNATEFLPRGSLFVQPGMVDIEVLKPISTRNWKLETLDQHVEDLRMRVLESLGQKEPESTTEKSTAVRVANSPKLHKGANR